MARPAMEQISSTAHRREKWRGKAALRKADYKRHRRCISVTKEVTPRKAESCEREACQCQHELCVIGNSDCKQITKTPRVRDSGSYLVDDWRRYLVVERARDHPLRDALRDSSGFVLFPLGLAFFVRVELSFGTYCALICALIAGDARITRGGSQCFRL